MPTPTYKSEGGDFIRNKSQKRPLNHFENIKMIKKFVRKFFYQKIVQ